MLSLIVLIIIKLKLIKNQKITKHGNINFFSQFYKFQKFVKYKKSNIKKIKKLIKYTKFTQLKKIFKISLDEKGFLISFKFFKR